MQKLFRVLICCVVILAVVAGVFAVVFLGKDRKYQEAVYSMDNYYYALAMERFLAINNYKDSEKMAAQMAEMTEDNKTAVGKLFPECDLSHRIKIQYWCPEACIGLRVYWDLESGNDLYVQWDIFDTWSSNHELEEQLFGEIIVMNPRMVRYDANSGEYLFTKYVGEFYGIENCIPVEITFRAALNQDSSLSVYNDSGAAYVFYPYSYSDFNVDTTATTILNPDLTARINAGKPSN